MGDFVGDCVGVLNFAFSWISDNTVYKLFGILAALCLVGALFSFGEKTALAPVVALVSLVIGIGIYYYTVNVILKALTKKGFKTIEYGFGPFLNLVWLGILIFFSTLLPWMDTRLLVLSLIVLFGVLALGIGVIFTAVNAFASTHSFSEALSSSAASLGGLLALMVLLGLIGVCLYVYVSVRLFASTYLFYQGRASGTNAIKKSWELTNGKVGKIFGTGFVVGLILLVAYVILLIPFGLIAWAETSIYGLPIITTLIGALLLRPAIQFISSYVGAGIYSLIDTPGAAAPQPSQAPPQDTSDDLKKQLKRTGQMR